MSEHAFTGDVKPGGLTESFEIKILICYLLHHIHRPMSFAEINEIMRTEGIANYFEYSQAISKLLASGHIVAQNIENGAEQFTVSDLGVKTAVSFEKDVPAAIRQRTLKAAQDYYLRKQIEQDNTVLVQKVPDGYSITMSITDMGSDLMSLSLFVPGEKDCNAMRERFYADPALIYRGVIALLTGNESVIQSILRQNDTMQF